MGEESVDDDADVFEGVVLSDSEVFRGWMVRSKNRRDREAFEHGSRKRMPCEMS